VVSAATSCTFGQDTVEVERAQRLQVKWLLGRHLKREFTHDGGFGEQGRELRVEGEMECGVDIAVNQI
jgi:hypothetical protein